MGFWRDVRKTEKSSKKVLTKQTTFGMIYNVVSDGLEILSACGMRTLKTIHKRSKDKARSEDLRKQMLEEKRSRFQYGQENAKREIAEHRIKFESLILAQDERWRRA